MAQLVKELDTEEALTVLDLGSTSPANIRYCTERGHKIYSDDLLVSSTDPSLVTKDEDGKTVLIASVSSRKISYFQRRSLTLSSAGTLPTIWMKAWSSRLLGACGHCLSPAAVCWRSFIRKKRDRKRLATAITLSGTTRSRCS